jgi:hypothetical protein
MAFVHEAFFQGMPFFDTDTGYGQEKHHDPT